MRSRSPRRPSSQPCRWGASRTAGLYLHVPFCAHRCGYCDFNTYDDLGHLMQRYTAALRADLRAVAEAGPAAVAPLGAEVPTEWPGFDSVFVGGGTPTLLPADELAAVLRDVRDVLPLTSDAEITVEANPESVDADYFRVIVAAGVNRVSMGAQSFAPAVLRFLERLHDPETPLRAVADARAAGVDQVNLDLIYGTPAETNDDWAAGLAAAVAAGTDHLSAYALTLEPNTPYGAQVRAGQKPPPDDDVAAARMAIASQVLGAAGFVRYEISNWAKPGAQCRHNLTYWRDGDWLGVGAGAHGHWAGRRWWSLRAPARYAEAALGRRSTTAGEEIPDAAGRRTERLMLGLRLAEGVERQRVAPLDKAAVGRLSAAGLLIADDERLRLTEAGMALANAVIVELMG